MKKIFSLIFCFIIAFPLLQMVSGVLPEVRVEEKRILAPFPELTLEQQAVEDLTAYVNDNFGFRGSLIFLNNFIDLKVFGISPNKEVIIGRAGWLYYRPSYESNMLMVNGVEALSVAKKIKNFQQKITGDGKKFVFVLAPDKESIYPEFLREELVGEKNYEVIMGALKIEGVNTFDGLEVLRKAKKSGNGKAVPVYSKNDTHWTRYGLFLTINEVLKALDRDVIDLGGLEDVQRIGDLSRLLGFNSFETVPQPVIVKDEIVADERVLIFHDSFFDNEMYFNLVFINFKKIHWLTGSIRQAYENLKNSHDVVILEIAERDFLALGEDFN